jgi:hypothetical protein
MKYAADMGSGAMIYTPGFIKIGSAIQNLIGGKHRHAERAWRLHKLSFIFFMKRLFYIFAFVFSITVYDSQIFLEGNSIQINKLKKYTHVTET